MNVPYLVRLLCVCVASFFLLHLALAWFARAVSPWLLERARRVAERDSASSAARLLLAFRLSPALLALVTVASLCLPSFVSLENDRGVELAGAPFLAAAFAGAAIWAISFWRATRAVLRTHRSLECRRLWEGGADTVWLWEGAAPFLGLAGVIRPRVVLSRKVADALEPEQLSAALRHERAHRESSDNLKRLLLLLTPDALPGMRWHSTVDRHWARYAEWAADDRAVGQDAASSVSLAEALVRVARLGAAYAPSPLVSPFVPDSGDIRARVERLLTGSRPPARPSRLWSGMALTLLMPVAAALAMPHSLASVHSLIETLMH